MLHCCLQLLSALLALGLDLGRLQDVGSRQDKMHLLTALHMTHMRHTTTQQALMIRADQVRACQTSIGRLCRGRSGPVGVNGSTRLGTELTGWCAFAPLSNEDVLHLLCAMHPSLKVCAMHPTSSGHHGTVMDG